MTDRPRVLLVDDDDDARSSLAWILDHHRFDVTTAATGREALARARPAPDLVVLDLVLPDLNGYEVCRRLKADPDTARAAVLMLSGRAVGSVDRAHGLDEGADAFLLKPAEPDVLVAQLRALLRVRRAEDAARASDARFRAVVESADAAIVSTGYDLVVQTWNPAAERLFGYAAAEMLGRSLFALIPPDQHDASRRVGDRVRAGEHVPPYETVRLRKDGRPAHVSVRVWAVPGDPGGLAVAYTDLTARRAAERAGAALRASSEAVCTLDREWRFTFLNPQAERLLRRPADDLLGRNAWEAFPERVGSAAYAAYHRAVADGVPVEFEDFSPVLGRWFEVRAFPSPEGLSIHFLDVTDRNRLQAQFLQAQKMEAVGRLAGGVAHDFNNLLTVINGFTDLALGAAPPDSPQAPLLAEVRKAGDRAAGLTGQLLAFSRQAVVAPRVLDPNAVVRDIERMLQRLIGEDIDLAVRLDPGVGWVKIDPGQLEQVLMNLAVNARDAMPTGGQLTIETRNTQLDEGYARAHPGVEPGRYVLVAVADTGAGMTDEVRAKVFEPFFTTKGPGRGTGLGLATVFGIVRQAGGSVEVYSEVGVGTTVKVYLPRCDEAAWAGPGPSVVLPPARGTETVLLVEDEEAVRALAGYVLREAGYTVLEAASGGQAVAVLAAHPGPVHVLVTDVVMPGMGGRELAGRLAAARPGLRVLYLSGYTDDAVVRHGVLEAHVRFLQKPFTPAALARAVRDALDAAE